MRDKDWVKARAACSLDAVFDALEVAVRKDLNRLKHETPWKGENLTFGTRDDTFFVRNPHTGVTVYFGTTRKRVKAVYSDATGEEKCLIAAKPALSMKAECVLKTKEGKVLKGWQFRMKALEKVFFVEEILDENA